MLIFKSFFSVVKNSVDFFLDISCSWFNLMSHKHFNFSLNVSDNFIERSFIVNNSKSFVNCMPDRFINFTSRNFSALISFGLHNQIYDWLQASFLRNCFNHIQNDSHIAFWASAKFSNIDVMITNKHLHFMCYTFNYVLYFINDNSFLLIKHSGNIRIGHKSISFIYNLFKFTDNVFARWRSSEVFSKVHLNFFSDIIH